MMEYWYMESLGYRQVIKENKGTMIIVGQPLTQKKNQILCQLAVTGQGETGTGETWKSHLAINLIGQPCAGHLLSTYLAHCDAYHCDAYHACFPEVLDGKVD